MSPIKKYLVNRKMNHFTKVISNDNDTTNIKALNVFLSTPLNLKYIAQSKHLTIFILVLVRSLQNNDNKALECARAIANLACGPRKTSEAIQYANAIPVLVTSLNTNNITMCNEILRAIGNLNIQNDTMIEIFIRNHIAEARVNILHTNKASLCDNILRNLICLIQTYSSVAMDALIKAGAILQLRDSLQCDESYQTLIKIRRALSFLVPREAGLQRQRELNQRETVNPTKRSLVSPNEFKRQIDDFKDRIYFNCDSNTLSDPATIFFHPPTEKKQKTQV